MIVNTPNMKKFQHQIGKWSKKNFGDQPSYLPLLGAVEELGELAHHHLKEEQGIRTTENHKMGKLDAVGDIIIYLTDYCEREGLEITEAIIIAMTEVMRRNWVKNKETGK